MKKILAVLLAFAMLFAFASCGGKDTDESTTTTTEDIFAGLEEDTTAADDTTVAADATTAESETTLADESTTAADETTTAAAVESTTAAGETTTAATTKASAGLNSTDNAEIVEYYKAAVKKTGRVTDTKKMWLSGDITGEGAVGTALSFLQPIIKSIVEGQGGTKERDLPGSDENNARIQAGDVAKAVASSKDGKTTIAIQLKDQIDGPEANGKTDGPVARGIGTLEGLDSALDTLGATISRGRETVKLTYDNATIKVVVDEKTGKIIEGSWKYDINIDVADADIKMAGINLAAKNLHAVLGFSIEL